MSDVKQPEISIHKLVAKADLKNKKTQTLLVIGTAKRDDELGDIWVGFGAQMPECLASTQEWGRPERATYVNAEAIRSFDLSEKNDSNPFGIKLEESERFWVARFDFADHTIHPNHKNFDDHKSLEYYWLNFVKEGKEDDATNLFPVVACFSKTSSDPNPLDMSWFKPFGVPFARSFSPREIIYSEPFELGVLLIHGIGNHPVRETLIQFGEPFIEFWKQWLKQVSRRSAQKLSKESRQSLYTSVINGVLRNRQNDEGIKKALNIFREENYEQKNSSSGEVSDIPCVGLFAEDTIFQNIASEIPSSTLFRFSLIRGDGGINESYVLMTEGWWTDDTVYPTFSELVSWIFKTLPMELRLHFDFMIQSLACEVYEIDNHHLRKSPGFWAQLRTGIEFLIDLAKLLFLPLMFMLAVVVQTILLLLIFIRLLPVKWLRSLVNLIIEGLMSTIGQSYALKISSVRRNAIMRNVMKDLEWMTNKCNRIVVISHSQGAEIARLIFQNQHWPSVKRWYTAGSGIKPLTMMEEGNFSKHKPFAIMMTICSILTIAGLIALLLTTKFFPLEVLTISNMSISYVVLFLALLVFTCGFPPKLTMPSLNKQTTEIWHDIFASHDPVPGGSFVNSFKSEMEDKELPVPKQTRIHNTRFGLYDHTSYFENTEQVIAPIALELFKLAGLADCVQASKNALKDAANRRDWWTSVRMVVRTIALILFVFMFYQFDIRYALYVGIVYLIWRWIWMYPIWRWWLAKKLFNDLESVLTKSLDDPSR